MTAVLEGQRKTLGFVNFKDYILLEQCFNDTSIDFISERFYREMIALYDQYFPEDHNRDNESKFAYLKDSVTEFHGEPKREGNAVCIGVYKKGKANSRNERNLEESGGNLLSRRRWFCDRISFFTYSMVWHMRFHLPGRNTEHTFEETIYTSKREHFSEYPLENHRVNDEFELYLEAKVHAIVMERMMNPHHKDHQEFSQYPNQWRNPRYLKTWLSVNRFIYEFQHPFITNITLSNGKQLEFVWLYDHKDFRPIQENVTPILQGIPCRVDIPKIIRVGQEKKDPFLRLAEELDAIPPDDHFIERVKQKIEEVWKGDNFCDKKQKFRFLTAYLNWVAATFDELHAGLRRLKKEQNKFLNPPIVCCCIPTEALSPFEEVAQSLQNGNVQDPLAAKAKNMIAHYQNIKDRWAALYEVQEKFKLMKSLVEQYGPYSVNDSVKQSYSCPPLDGIDHLKVPPLDIKGSLLEWEAVLDRWASEAERVLGRGNNMESFCERVNSGVHRV